MKLVFLTVSLIAAFTVDCRSQPEPASLHSDIAEQPQWPNSEDGDSEDTTSMPTLPHVVPDRNLGLDASEDEDPEERSLDTDIPTPLMPDFTIGEDDFDAEEDEEQGENEPRGSGCKAKALCTFGNGKCIASSAPCYGRRFPDGCKGRHCDCCLPECPYTDGFFSPTGSRQCFKFFYTQTNWTNAKSICQNHNPPLKLAHPNDAISLRSYTIQKFGDYTYTWLDARGTGSYFQWQDDKKNIMNDNPLWYLTPDTSPDYCLLNLAGTDEWKRSTNRTYYYASCSRTIYYPLCELTFD